MILDALSRTDELYGYQLRAQIDREHALRRIEANGSAVYGTIKRLVSEGLVLPIRTERAGNRPERQIISITTAGRAALPRLRGRVAESVVVRADPFDLLLTHLDRGTAETLGTIIACRMLELECRIVEQQALALEAQATSSHVEVLVLQHKCHLLRTEISWHEQLAAALPEILADLAR